MVFYSAQLLTKEGPLGVVWIAAHLDKQLRRRQIAEASIPVTVDTICNMEMRNPDAPLYLRLSGQLLLGVVRIYARKVNYLQQDCSDALGKLQHAFKPPTPSKTRSVNLLDDSRTAAKEVLDLPDALEDLDIFFEPEPMPVQQTNALKLSMNISTTTGTAAGYSFDYGNSYMDGEGFEQFEDVLPGDIDMEEVEKLRAAAEPAGPAFEDILPAPASPELTPIASHPASPTSPPPSSPHSEPVPTTSDPSSEPHSPTSQSPPPPPELDLLPPTPATQPDTEPSPSQQAPSTLNTRSQSEAEADSPASTSAATRRTRSMAAAENPPSASPAPSPPQSQSESQSQSPAKRATARSQNITHRPQLAGSRKRVRVDVDQAGAPALELPGQAIRSFLVDRSGILRQPASKRSKEAAPQDDPLSAIPLLPCTAADLLNIFDFATTSAAGPSLAARRFSRPALSPSAHTPFSPTQSSAAGPSAPAKQPDSPPGPSTSSAHAGPTFTPSDSHPASPPAPTSPSSPHPTPNPASPIPDPPSTELPDQPLEGPPSPQPMEEDPLPHEDPAAHSPLAPSTSGGLQHGEGDIWERLGGAAEQDEEEVMKDSVHAASFTTRTKAMVRLLQRSMHGQQAPLQSAPLLSTCSRMSASRAFFELLVLRSKGYLHLHQPAPFTPLTITPCPAWATITHS